MHCLFYCLMHLLCLCHSFVEKALRSWEQTWKDRKQAREKTERNREQASNMHETWEQKQSLQQSETRKIIIVIEASCFIEELFCYFVLSSIWCIKSIIFREKVCAFLYTRHWWLGFEHCTRQYSKANIRQVFIYKTKLQKIVSLQFYYWSQSMSHCLLSKCCFKKSFETH